jgi:NAD(P)-dependent dehydrogenase (short-subunit alcohol dehydrogenase family)
MDSVAYLMAMAPRISMKTVNLVEKTGRRIVAEHADVRDFQRLRAVVDNAVAELGRVDFVLANAGIAPVMGEPSREISTYRDAVDVMFNGAYYTVEAALPRCWSTATVGQSSSPVPRRGSNRRARRSAPKATARQAIPPPSTVSLA